MKTILNKYHTDPRFHNVVNYIIRFIEEYGMTPYEIREACHIACIKYEMENIREIIHTSDDVNNALLKLHEFDLNN